MLLRAAGQTAFLGSTLGRRCLGTLRGATFATSEVVVLRDVLLGWDRGFGGSGEEVWSAENDLLIFRKIKNLGLD